MLVKIPRNETVLRELGPYVSCLNVGDRKRTAVQRQLRRAGLAGYEAETQATLLSLVQLSRRPAEFFDVGAHIGLYSALIGAVFPNDLVHVTCFEPTPETADMCLSIADANRIPIQLERLALSSEEGTATLFISMKAETSNSLAAGFRESAESVTVPVTTLDAYCDRVGRFPTVIKIDVETFESYVLRGAMQTIADARPSVVCEILPAAAPEATESVLRAIVDLGYRINRWGESGRWEPGGIDDVLTKASHTHRDWLFSPGDLEETFHTAHRQWLAAIADCTNEQNVFLDGGVAPSAGWNESYRVAMSTP
jgi:FkbM family methyltransferase